MITDWLFWLYSYREVMLGTLSVAFLVSLSAALYCSWKAYRATPRPTKSKTRLDM